MPPAPPVPPPLPPKPPKPALQPVGPGVLIMMEFAVIAPALLAWPMAVAHLPTTAVALVAATV